MKITAERALNEKGTADYSDGHPSIEFHLNGAPIGIWVDFEHYGHDSPRVRLFGVASELLDVCKRVYRAMSWAYPNDRMSKEEQEALLKEVLAKVESL